MSLKYGKIGGNLRKCPYNLINRGISKVRFCPCFDVKKGVRFHKMSLKLTGGICMCGYGHMRHPFSGE